VERNEPVSLSGRSLSSLALWDDGGMKGLSASGLANLAGVTVAQVQRLVELGILTARDGPDPFLKTDVPKVRLAAACERAGLPMEGIAAVIRSGRLSFALLEAALYRRWAVRTWLTYRQVSQDTGLPLELLASALERCWPGCAANKSWCGPRAWSSMSRTSWRRPGRWGGPAGSRPWCSWTWWATPASPRNKAMPPLPSWPSPWRCWSTGPRVSTAGCPSSGWVTG
jgi:hypothetical protein